MRTNGIRASKSRTRKRPARISLTVQNPSGADGLPAASTLRRWLARAVERDATITIRFVGAAEGRRLNRAYRNRDYATNVLTFAYTAQSDAELAGDVVLCVPVLRREATAQRRAVRAHCAHLVIHGALHLAGYDHETDKDAKVMEALETGILQSLGYDDPYATSGESGNEIR